MSEPTAETILEAVMRLSDIELQVTHISFGFSASQLERLIAGMKPGYPDTYRLTDLLQVMKLMRETMDDERNRRYQQGRRDT